MVLNLVLTIVSAMMKMGNDTKYLIWVSKFVINEDLTSPVQKLPSTPVKTAKGSQHMQNAMAVFHN